MDTLRAFEWRKHQSAFAVLMVLFLFAGLAQASKSRFSGWYTQSAYDVSTSVFIPRSGGGGEWYVRTTTVPGFTAPARIEIRSSLEKVAAKITYTRDGRSIVDNITCFMVRPRAAFLSRTTDGTVSIAAKGKAAASEQRVQFIFPDLSSDDGTTRAMGNFRFAESRVSGSLSTDKWSATFTGHSRK